MAILAQLQFIEKPLVRCHVRFADGDQPHPGLRHDRRLVIRTVVGFVAKQARTRWQNIGQFMHRRQIVKAARYQGETDRHAARGTDQVQPPAEELFLFRRAVAAILPSADLATAARAGAATNWYWRT